MDELDRVLRLELDIPDGEGTEEYCKSNGLDYQEKMNEVFEQFWRWFWRGRETRPNTH